MEDVLRALQRWFGDVFNLENVAILAGASIGSVKASLTFNTGKSAIEQVLDSLIGVFLGFAVAWYFRPDPPFIAMEAIIAFVAGVSGALCTEVFLEVLPASARKIIQDRLQKFNDN